MQRMLANVTAARQSVDGTNAAGQRRHQFTSMVELRGNPTWMKPGSPVITAVLTPTEARHLALELLQAAERTEQ